jgi:ribosomal protein S18 acetylase RimI-like enzyme
LAQAVSDGVAKNRGGQVTSRISDRVVGFLAPGESPSAGDLNLVSSGKATLRFCVGNEEAQSRVFIKSINWNRVILARENGATVGFLSFFQNGSGPFNVGRNAFTKEFGLVSGALRFWAYKVLEKRCARPTCYVYKLAVIGGMRNAGIGTSMMACLISHAKAARLSSIELDVFGKNTKAAELYAGIGFIETRKVDLKMLGRLLPDATIIRMKKTLSV